MRRISISKGLDVPISGQPANLTTSSEPIAHVALIGDDYPGMRPTMHVSIGDRVACGQPLFSDKKNEGVVFVAPGAGEVTAINRGEKRKFESVVIRLDGDETVSFCTPLYAIVFARIFINMKSKNTLSETFNSILNFSMSSIFVLS